MKGNILDRASPKSSYFFSKRKAWLLAASSRYRLWPRGGAEEGFQPRASLSEHGWDTEATGPGGLKRIIDRYRDPYVGLWPPQDDK